MESESSTLTHSGATGNLANFAGMEAAGSGPDEWPWFCVTLVEVLVDRGLQVDDRVEATAPFAPALERGEECLHGIEPRAGRGREVERPAWMPREASPHLRMIVDGVVVDDSLDDPVGWHRPLDRIEKRMNSSWGWRCIHRPITVPSSTFSAANGVVVPWRW